MHVLLLALATAALAGTPKSDKLAEKAHHLVEIGRWGDAQAVAEQAVAAGETPASLQALVRAQAMVLAMLADPQAFGGFAAQKGLDPEAAARLQQALVEDQTKTLEASLVKLEAAYPQSVMIGIARTALQQTGRKELLPLVDPSCPDDAWTAFQAAEASFRDGAYAAADGHYQRAVGLCPEASIFWTYAGDALHAQGDDRGAVQRYDRALAVDPCNHVAQRFAADVLMAIPGKSVDDEAATLDHAVGAVACNPQYEAGWSTLKALIGSGLARHVTRFDLKAADPDALALLLQRAATAPGDDALARRVAAAQAVLDGEHPATAGWARLADARAAGLLDAAVAFETLDAEIAPIYRARRLDLLPRLKAWVIRGSTDLPR